MSLLGFRGLECSQLSHRKADKVFDHSKIDDHSFDQVPLNQDIYLVDEKWMIPYERMLSDVLAHRGEYEHIGYVSYVAARRVQAENIELSWYANVHDRFHEISIVLPRQAFVRCVECQDIDEKPRIFVDTNWLENLHLRSHTVFAMIDAIGVKNALANNEITKEGLASLRIQVDEIAQRFPNVAFISFADSIILKSNWTVGLFESGVSYTYRPEVFLEVFSEIKDAFFATFGLGVYGVFAQGTNEYYDDSLLHISKSHNHIGLNSLGTPFAQLSAIEGTARKRARANCGPSYELYMDSLYFHSLKFGYPFDKQSLPAIPYEFSGLTGYGEHKYYQATLEQVVPNLE